MLVASIVAGEVGGSVPGAREWVACQVVRDAEEGVWLPGRWYGWGEPTQLDMEAARDALYTDACDDVPAFRFLGNEGDLRIWRGLGYVDEGDACLRMRGSTGLVVIGVLEYTWDEYFEWVGGPVPE